MNTKKILLTEKLTDEKFDWLELQEEKCKDNGKRFDIDRMTDVWYTSKIAELILMIESK